VASSIKVCTELVTVYKEEVQMAIKTVSQAEQALAELAERFRHWRRHRAHRHERIPAPLWDQAVVLSEVLPNGQVASPSLPRDAVTLE
jgi:hypothetical protein